VHIHAPSVDIHHLGGAIDLDPETAGRLRIRDPEEVRRVRQQAILAAEQRLAAGGEVELPPVAAEEEKREKERSLGAARK
jgi:hypothetical protein